MRRAFIWLAAAVCIAALASLPARADAVISGPACVVDGNRIQIGGKVRDGFCWGGIDVILHGSRAPGYHDKCHNKAGIEWDCGQTAIATLKSIIRLATATCYHIDGEFENGIPIATCLTGRRDISREMVRAGMAKAGAHESSRYLDDAKEAKRRRKGIWK